MNRREFLRTAASATSLLALGAASAGAQDEGAATSSGNANNASMQMNQDAYRPVKLPPRVGAKPQLTNDQRDALEHHLHCQCGCGLDVYTCRTTDFTCSVSPAMHVDVMGLVTGGYVEQEILAAFQKAYGERVLMEPVRSGFNLVGYFLPFVVLVGGGAFASVLLRRWTTKPVALAAPAPVDATPDELRRLDAALRDDA